MADEPDPHLVLMEDWEANHLGISISKLTT